MLRTPTLHLGAPSQIGPLTIFPVWTDAPVPKRPIRTAVPRAASIGEIDGAAVVQRLTVDNPTTKTFLLPAGGVFEGGRQERALLHSVVVGPESRLDVEVRCVEQGRWAGDGGQRLHRRRAPLAVRGALSGIVGPNRRHGGHHDGAAQRGDQAQVWDRVSRYEDVAGRSGTGSLLEATGRTSDVLLRELGGIRPLFGQRGVLIGIGGHPALLEVFDHPKLLAEEWEPILTGVAADAAFAPVVPTLGRRARFFADHVSNLALRPWAQAGEAIAAEYRDTLAVVDAVIDSRTGVPLPPIHITALNARHALVAA